MRQHPKSNDQANENVSVDSNKTHDLRTVSPALVKPAAG